MGYNKDNRIGFTLNFLDCECEDILSDCAQKGKIKTMMIQCAHQSPCLIIIFLRESALIMNFLQFLDSNIICAYVEDEKAQ